MAIPDTETIERRAPLTRDRVLQVAMALADRDGLEALSMRKLGQELGVDAMALYRHVRNKDDLFDGIIERIVGEIERPDPAGPWKAALREQVMAARQRDAASPVGAARVRGPRHGRRRGHRLHRVGAGDPPRRRVLSRPRPPHAARARQPHLRVQPGPLRRQRTGGALPRRRRDVRTRRWPPASRASPSWRCP